MTTTETATAPTATGSTLPDGGWPVMLTPFREDRSLDFEQVDALTDWLIDNGAAGIFTVALSSEMYDLTEEERSEAIDQIREAVGEDVFQIRGASYLVSGAPVLADGLTDELQGQITILLIAALVVMALMLALVFNPPLRLLPLGIGLEECLLLHERALEAVQLGLECLAQQLHGPVQQRAHRVRVGQQAALGLDGLDLGFQRHIRAQRLGMAQQVVQLAPDRHALGDVVGAGSWGCDSRSGKESHEAKGDVGETHVDD